ncbi:hypothetical protein MYU51_004437 [Penicillium brevicompactum]|uniref:uncharacterized protein n=1 Tax=Penicillium brevicompactum TaxID=5074 RepID=UPI00254143F2|nr:uncharacterized protein N7506_000465 [Penicillium brevicompactum]KAJ5347212.1 hypothetical protein N7506_000465 [Penicillium brevicompactum]
MGRINDGLPVLYLAVATGLYYNPEYAILNSRIVTGLVLLAIVAAFKVLYQFSLYPEYFTPLKHIQTPPERTWLRGNTESFFLETPYIGLEKWTKTMRNDDLLRYYVVGNLERVMCTSPKALSELLVTKVYDFEKPEIIRESLRRVTGDGILLAEGEEHKIQRKNLMPAFAYRHIKDLYPVFWAKSVEMVNLIQEDLNNPSRKTASKSDNTIRIDTWASRTTLDIIGVAGMDNDFDSLRNPDNKLNQSYRQIMSPPSAFMKTLFVIGMLFGKPTWTNRLPTARNKEIIDSGEVIRNVARQMIRQKKAKMEDPTAEAGIDIISVALKSGTFDEENLVDQSMTFLGAGHETTATALQWAIYALCKNPNVQSKLRDEIRANLPSPDDSTPITAAQIDNLPYLNAVCNEVLRYYPSVPATIRKAVRDTSLAGKHIPKDTLFIIAPRILNRMEEFWGEDADKFNPERFMGPGKANTGGATSNYAFLTFLHGPRSCIGQGFAKAELACMVATMVGRYHIELKFPNAKLEVREGATVCPRDGVITLMTKLEGW